MIVYQDRERLEPAAGVRDRALSAAGRAAETGGHDDAVELLVECGELEAAAADELMPERESLPEPLEHFATATLAAARMVRASWREQPPDASRRWAVVCRAALHRAALPATVLPMRVSEGFAWYGLHPETYLDAAARFHRDAPAGRVVCLGLRGIGAALSALVAAELESGGREVARLTARPRGDPFDRAVRLTDTLASELRNWRPVHAVVVDEGPGLSGSSLAAGAAAAEALGVRADRIALFPSHNADHSRLLSPKARRRFERHRAFVVSADQALVRSGRLGRALGAEILEDISAGRWRESLGSPGVAVQPQHERRKLLCGAEGGGRVLAKFAGLGRYGRATMQRAQRLADDGHVVRPRALKHGYLVSELVAGTPLARGTVTNDDARLVAAHIAGVAKAFRTGRVAKWDELAPMTRANTEAALGPAWAARIDRLSPPESEAVALDARMLAHEWLRPEGRSESARLLKTDAADHWDDHFFPGPSDPAWDVAAAGEELDLGPAGRAALTARYAELAGDPTVARRLPAYGAAYLAFRTGYAALAADTLGGTAEEPLWRGELARYTAGLEDHLRSL